MSTVKKQVLGEVGHDIMNYQCQGLNYQLKLKSEADNIDARFDNSCHNVKTEFNYYFIIHLFSNNLQSVR